jgi:hypothetical protein
MSMVRSPILLLLLMWCGLVWAAPGPQKHTVRRHAAKQKETDPAPPMPAAPLTPEQMPASPPHVEYHNGELTIVAQNSTLGDILRAVRSQTGATLDVPAGATERVVIRVGPGPARQVLAELLNGTRFNYVMLGSAADPSGVQRVILTLKPPEPPPGSNAIAAQPTYTPPMASDQAESSNSDTTDTDDEDSGGDDAAAAPSNPDDQQGQTQGGQQPQSTQPSIKTPQQMLEELQRQLQQQQQEQGAPPPGQAQPQPIPRRDQR